MKGKAVLLLQPDTDLGPASRGGIAFERRGWDGGEGEI